MQGAQTWLKASLDDYVYGYKNHKFKVKLHFTFITHFFINNQVAKGAGLKFKNFKNFVIKAFQNFFKNIN